MFVFQMVLLSLRRYYVWLFHSNTRMDGLPDLVRVQVSLPFLPWVDPGNLSASALMELCCACLNEQMSRLTFQRERDMGRERKTQRGGRKAGRQGGKEKGGGMKYPCVLCLCVWVYICAPLYEMSVEARKEWLIHWDYRYVWAISCGHWELKPGPLEEQSVLLTSETSQQPQRTSFNKTFKLRLTVPQPVMNWNTAL